MATINGRITAKVTIRGSALTTGRFAFYFKQRGSTNLLQNKHWFSIDIPTGASLDVVKTILSNPANIYTYVQNPPDFTDDPKPFPGPAYVQGWPTTTTQVGGGTIPLLYQNPIVYKTADVLGEKLVMEFILHPACFEFYSNKKLTSAYGEVDVSVEQEKGLSGFGSLNIACDYSSYIRFMDSSQTTMQKQTASGAEVYMSLRFMVNTWMVDESLAAKEDVGKSAKYFYIPVYAGDTLAAIASRINNGESAWGSRRACKSLKAQLNEYFNQMGAKTGLIEQDAFNVLAKASTGLREYTAEQINSFTKINDGLEVRIWGMSENIQHEVSVTAYQTDELYTLTLCNQYFIADNMFELRSYYDMYGIDKPKMNQVSTQYKPLAYGFKFNLNYITDYQETESSTIDVTPIPGQSSAKAIGIDATGATRDITIQGIRVDNSNYWMFHVPWQEQGKNQGIIYTGTSNWGWVKFMKAVLGCFQMTSGPYRLIMLTIPSSAQMQYFPTRDGTYQYSDGTYIFYVGWEDMCYVMVENFTYSRSEEMFNAINYSLKLKRVTPLISNQ